MKFQQLKTIIFDLGGVIVDLEVSRTIYAFAALSGRSVDEVRDLYTSHPLFLDFEKGLIDAAEFRSGVKALFGKQQLTDTQIDDAWNAMLLGIPLEKLTLMERLKENFTVMILSNTNVIHVSHLHDQMLPASAGVSSFEPFVHRVYYSNEMGLRKPDPDIFTRVLVNDNLLAEETVFLDDNPDNVGVARSLGIQVALIEHPDNVYALFSDV